MSQESKIQWTGGTWNPWQGCQKVSLGCKYCYMFRDKAKYGQDPNKVVKSKTVFEKPLKWKDSKLIFTCSWSDWFIQEADAWRDEAWDIIRKTPQHTYQILTKRPERIKANLPSDFDTFKNVWIGVTIESENEVDRLDYLQDLPCITFASFEPLLSPIKWNSSMTDLDWCIVGGESGNDTGFYRYRKMELDWAESLVLNAKKNGVPCFFKQFGTYQAKKLGLKNRHGGEYDEFPTTFKVREFPISYSGN